VKKKKEIEHKTISIKEMIDLSNKLFDLNKDEWAPKTPESNIYWFSWLIGEIGEVIDILKKKGVNKIMEDKNVRHEMLEEITDCYMYLADILNRYQYTPEEFSKVYKDKMKYNFKRDYSKGKTSKDKGIKK
jgi:NTP pyrophosphatase (non-canonical NTP hydrolase)